MSQQSKPGMITFGDADQGERRKEFLDLLRNSPLPDDELFLNIGLFLTPQTLGRVLFMDFLYRQVLDIQGIVMEFGCRWGQNLSLFTALRGIYEPYNRLRKVVGFDTFEGLPASSKEDGGTLSPGMYSVPPGYQDYLDRVLSCQERESPLSHLTKYEICKGDASVRVREYLERNQETVVALAYFDLDLYEPTRECLLAIKDRLTRGSVIGFDELNDSVTPGETLALKEVFGLDRFSIRRFPASSRTSYVVVDGHPSHSGLNS